MDQTQNIMMMMIREKIELEKHQQIDPVSLLEELVGSGKDHSSRMGQKIEFTAVFLNIRAGYILCKHIDLSLLVGQMGKIKVPLFLFALKITCNKIDSDICHIVCVC